jgi:hypothetical protein
VALPQVTGVIWWEMMISHYQGIYRRARAGEPPGGYTRDFLQGPRPISDALRTMFRGAPLPYEDLTYRWPGGSFSGGRIYPAADFSENRRVEVGQWTGRGAPHPWRIGDPSSDPVVTLAGSLEPAIPAGANAQWTRLAVQEPWLVMVQLDWSVQELHLRAYLANPPRGRAETSIERIPASLRALMRKRGGAVLGGKLPDLWFDPSDLRDPWRLAPAATPTSAAQATRKGRSRGTPLGGRYRTADESSRRKPPEPFEVDPDALDRSTRLHAATQNALSKAVERRGFEPRSPVGEPNYDLAWEEPEGRIVVAEVKSVKSTNVERQLRLGLGQVLRYRALLRAEGSAVQAVLALSGPPHDLRWVTLCQENGVALIWMPMLEEMLANALA